MTPLSPYSVVPAQIDEGPCFLIRDANDQIITTAFDKPMADFVCAKLNRRADFNVTAAMANGYIASMLAAFRLKLERDLDGPLCGVQLDVALLFDELADWFEMNIGQRALMCGSAALVYVARMDEAPTPSSILPRSAGEEVQIIPVVV